MNLHAAIYSNKKFYAWTDKDGIKGNLIFDDEVCVGIDKIRYCDPYPSIPNDDSVKRFMLNIIDDVDCIGLKRMLHPLLNLRTDFTKEVAMVYKVVRVENGDRYSLAMNNTKYKTYYSPRERAYPNVDDADLFAFDSYYHALQGANQLKYSDREVWLSYGYKPYSQSKMASPYLIEYVDRFWISGCQDSDSLSSPVGTICTKWISLERLVVFLPKRR